MNQDAPAPMSRSCIKCEAPVGPTGGRCPFCGTEQPVQPTPRSEIARANAGLVDANRKQMGLRPLVVVQAKPSSIPFGAIGAILAMAVVGAGALFYFRRPPPAPPPTPALTGLPPPPTASFGNIPVADPERADPTDLLPKVKRALASWDPDPQLVEILISGSTRGSANLKTPGVQLTYRYAGSKPPSPTAKGTDKTREGRVVVIKAGGSAEPEPTPIGAADKPIPEPNCVWSAAWRNAVKGGIPEGASVEGRYAMNAKAGEPRWTISVPGQPALTFDLDANSCSIKAR